MKKIFSLMSVILLVSLISSCEEPNSRPGTGTSPSASVASVTSPSPSTSATATPVPTPTPSPTPVPTPTPVPIPLEKQTFSVTIDLQDAIVPYTQVDGGETQTLPLTENLSGGKHDFLVGDVGTTCKFGKSVTVDKDHTKFIYKVGVDCNIGTGNN